MLDDFNYKYVLQVAYMGQFPRKFLSFSMYKMH